MRLWFDPKLFPLEYILHQAKHDLFKFLILEKHQFENGFLRTFFPISVLYVQC